MTKNIKNRSRERKCSLQFDNKVVYDMHMSLLHKEAKNMEQSANEEIKKEPEFADKINSLQNKKCTGFIQKSRTKTTSIDEGKKLKVCLYCDARFSFNSKLKRHVESVHEGKKPHKCSFCDYTCSEKGNLKMHIESVHEGKKLHKCSLCNLSLIHI